MTTFFQMLLRILTAGNMYLKWGSGCLFNSAAFSNIGELGHLKWALTRLSASDSGLSLSPWATAFVTMRVSLINAQPSLGENSLGNTFQ